MKNIFKKLVIVTSFALISCTGLHAEDPVDPALTFANVATKVSQDKDKVTAAIEAINSADLANGVLKSDTELTEEYKEIFTTNIEPQDDDDIKKMLTALYVAQIAGAAVYRVTIDFASQSPNQIAELNNFNTMIKEKVTAILTAIGYEYNKYKDIEIEENVIKVDDMLTIPTKMLEQIKQLIVSLTEARTNINQSYKDVSFKHMLEANFAGTILRERLLNTAEKIGELNNAFFGNIKTALEARGESIYKAKQAKPTDTKIDKTVNKDKVAQSFFSVFEDAPAPINPNQENQGDQNPE